MTQQMHAQMGGETAGPEELIHAGSVTFGSAGISTGKAIAMAMIFG